MALAKAEYPERIVKCEVCAKRDMVDGGLCPTCWDTAAAIVRKDAK
jgi:hypothetical protein